VRPLEIAVRVTDPRRHARRGSGDAFPVAAPASAVRVLSRTTATTPSR